ncbi:type II toxin-antitoxin system Phd/YefM family antitoxin [Burkholderia multivorans]|uniref:Type II toxin-antitoxin system Phd/YefM family antitoxin n=2 Tax=Burkholderia multivorans TaxID=87883 RepID=A0AAP2HQF1_9BURK|nr:type II toxin-antitoxin system Phd/YefM family antitoxin [Burkholderia multivorans]MBU9366537.1 type II toxin-antitoxin system Phd/YefM family antitoxin [Burkholderia multivorans]MBU9598438.1 type II toxin-antitoxin system Phd/YefM family antitoxin [Burkholderia multivorans]
MPTCDQDMVPISKARSRLTEQVDDAVAGTEKVLTKRGSPDVAFVDARRAGYDHALEAEHGRCVLLDDAERALEEARAGKLISKADFRKSLRRPAPGEI